MRLIFSILMAIVLIIAAIVFVGPLFISTDQVRNQIFAQVESATGYRLRVSGPVDITLFPSLELVAEDVGVAQPATGSETEFATAKTLKFGLMLQGLLDGKMRMTEVTLIDPVIAVPETGAAAPVPQAEPAAATDDAPAGGAPASRGPKTVAERLKNLSLDKLVVTNGTVILPPSGQAPGKRIEKLDLEASLPAYDEPLSFKTSALVDGKAMQAEGSIGNFGQFLDGAPAPVRLTADAPDTLDAPASLSGTATYKDEVLTLSQFSAKSGDKTLSGTAIYKDDTVTLNQFTATMGRDTFAGNAVYQDDTVTLSSLRANVRGTPLAGQVSANLADKVPYVVASLAAKTLDVNALTGAPKSKPSGGGGGAGGGAGGGGNSGGSSAGKSGGGGGGANSGWSNEKIDFAPLRTVNGKFSLVAEQLIYDDIKISPVTVQAALNGGKLSATLSKFNIYGGAGDAAVAVDASGKTPAQRVKLTLAKFDAYTFLKDAAGFHNLEGRGNITLDLSAAGASQRAIVSALTGNANVEFTNGAIRGVNIAKMVRNLGSGIVEGWQGGTTEKTDFASLGGSFKVAKGQAVTQDLHLSGPLVRMTGAGTVDIPGKRLNLKVDPQLVASLEGQGGKKDLAGLGVPVMIVGPWARPKLYPDIKGILENPAQAYQRYKQFGKDISKTGALQGVIKDGKVDKDALMQGIGGLLGGQTPQQGGAPATQATAEPEPQPKPTDPKKAADAKKKKSAEKKKNKKGQKPDTEDAAKQILENFLTGQ